MSIADQITRLNNAKAAIKQSIENKGVTVSDKALLDEYPALIDSIEVGSGGEGGGDPYYETIWNYITNNNTDYQYLFCNYNGTELDVSRLDTSKVTNMNDMFCDCGGLTSIDVSNFNTSNVTNMSGMFRGNINPNRMSIIGLENFNTSKVTNMSDMFYKNWDITSIDVSNFNTSNVTSMSDMFDNCRSLISLDVSNFNTSKVTSIGSMFSGCKNLITLDISNFDLIKATNANYILKDCNSLHTLRLDNCNNDTINKIITSKNFPTNAIEGVTRTIYCKEENAAGLTPPTNWVFSYVTEEEPEVPVDPPAGDIPLYVPGEFRGNTEITEVVTVVDESHTDLSYMFEGCNNLVSVNTQDWDVSNITTVNSMFSQIYGSNLATLDFSTWDTSNMTIMDSMFCYMQSGNLPKLDLSSFTTKKLQQAYSMFNWCNMLQELDIRNFELVHEDGTEVAIASMLEGCMSLHTLRLDNCSNATIRKIINESGMPQEPVYDYSISENINRKMYCKASEIGDLVAPNGWEFVTVE